MGYPLGLSHRPIHFYKTGPRQAIIIPEKKPNLLVSKQKYDGGNPQCNVKTHVADADWLTEDFKDMKCLAIYLSIHNLWCTKHTLYSYNIIILFPQFYTVLIHRVTQVSETAETKMATITASSPAASLVSPNVATKGFNRVSSPVLGKVNL